MTTKKYLNKITKTKRNNFNTYTFTCCVGELKFTGGTNKYVSLNGKVISGTKLITKNQFITEIKNYLKREEKNSFFQQEV
jgi:hypothetical protein